MNGKVWIKGARVLLRDKDKDRLGPLASTNLPRVVGAGVGGVGAAGAGGADGVCVDRLGAIEKLMLA